MRLCNPGFVTLLLKSNYYYLLIIAEKFIRCNRKSDGNKQYDTALISDFSVVAQKLDIKKLV